MTDTNQALQALLQAGQGKVTPFPPTSRYYGIDTVTIASCGRPNRDLSAPSFRSFTGQFCACCK